MAEVVGGQRHLVADLLAHLPHVLAEQVDAPVGDLQTGERMHHAVGVEHPRRRDDAVAPAGEQVDAEVHLQEAEAHLHALLQPSAHLAAAGRGGGVAVAQDAVAEPASGQGVHGHAVRLAGQVHQCHLDGADAAALPAVVAELLDLAEQPVDVARVLAEQA